MAPDVVVTKALTVAGPRRAGLGLRLDPDREVLAGSSYSTDASPGSRAYIEAKREADEARRASRLDWTILRRAWLTDDAAGAGPSSGETSRAVTSREATSRQ